MGRCVRVVSCLVVGFLFASCETTSESTSESVDCDFVDYKVTGQFQGAVCGDGSPGACRTVLVTARSDAAPRKPGQRLIKWRMPKFFNDVSRFDPEDGNCWLNRDDSNERFWGGRFYTVNEAGFSTVEIRPDYLKFRCEPTPNTRYLFSRNLPRYAVCPDPFEGASLNQPP